MKKDHFPETIISKLKTFPRMFCQEYQKAHFRRENEKSQLFSQKIGFWTEKDRENAEKRRPKTLNISSPRKDNAHRCVV